MWTIITAIVVGAIVGMLARLVLPGKQNISILMTVVLGVLGAIIGYFIWGLISGHGFTFEQTTGGLIDFWRLVISIIVAAVLVGAYAGTKGRKSVH